MLPIQRIYCPTDFSEPSYEAVEIANQLAAHFSAELVLLHVVTPILVMPAEPIQDNFDIPTYHRHMGEIAQKTLDELIKTRISEEIKSRTMVVQGNPADEITRLSAVDNADMIVIATHGLTGWRRLMFGSVAEKVVRLAECPVLTIPVSHEET
jgi:nucleotide-binding universal stress UspA family protein